MNEGVPVAEATSKDFMMVRAALVKRLGGANEALVWTRIDYRLQMRQPPHVDDDGIAWWPASRDALADETGLSPDAVKRALTTLLKGGFLEATEHRIGGNYDRTKSYRTLVEGRPVDWAESPNESGRNRPMDRAKSPNVPLFQNEEEPENARAKRPEVRLPNSWAPTASHFERARERGIDIAAEAEAFRLHAETHDRHAANWNAAFTTWLGKARVDPSVARAREVAPEDAWMVR